jgi:hypothetical protein
MAKKKLPEKIQEGNERGARRAILEDLFYDLNASRKQVYWMNFTRGIFLGFGTVIGGTLVVALIVWLLSLLVDLPGGIGDFVRFIRDTVQSGQ